MRVILAITLALACLGAGRVLADSYSKDIDTVFDEACDLYEQSDFGAALELFEALRAKGVTDPTLFYNLANAHYRVGNLGMAVANYRRALMLSPRDENTRTNLELVRSVVGIRDTTASYDLKSLVDLPLRLLSPREMQLSFYVCYYLASICLVGLLLVPRGIRTRGIKILIVLLVLTGAAYGLHGYGVERFRGDTDGVIIAEYAEFKSGPGDAFDELGRVPDGVEVKLRAKSGIWLEVRLPTGEIGWVHEKDIVHI